MSDSADQGAFAVRFEWGPTGLRALLSGGVRTIVIVDVLSFTTCVAIAAQRGAEVYPYPGKGTDAEGFAAARHGVLAGSRVSLSAEYSLSPVSMREIRAGTRLVLPSPNGATLAVEAAGHGTVIAGSLYNRSGVVRRLGQEQAPIGLIAAGERWPDGSLRPCLEDLLGCGAIAAGLTGSLSPEARAAVAVFQTLGPELREVLRQCSSGRELKQLGFSEDVELASTLDASNVTPVLHHESFQASAQ